MTAFEALGHPNPLASILATDVSERALQAPFDLATCRRVLIYFDGETVGR